MTNLTAFVERERSRLLGDLKDWLRIPSVSTQPDPTERNGNLYARGTADDKGQVFCVVSAIEGLVKERGSLPCNVRFLIEGEEEVGSRSLEKFLKAEPDRTRADAVLVTDVHMVSARQPSVDGALRGLVQAEISVRTLAKDAHSGLYGGAVPNAIETLWHLLERLKGPNGVIKVPGMYARVAKPTARELSAWKKLPVKERDFLKETGAKSLNGELKYSFLERVWSRPTLEVHGFRGGFTGEGAKTVIPAVGTAKISMRLVPDMEPKEAIRQFTAYVKKITPNGIKTNVRVLSSAPASVVSTESRWVTAAAEAMEQVFHKKTVYIRSGGSIPIVGLFQKHLGIPSVMMGFGLPDDNLHAPNEKFHLPNFYRGIEAVARYFELLAG